MDQTTSTLEPAAATPSSATVPSSAAVPTSRPNVADVRGQIPVEIRTRSTLRGLLSFATAALLYGITLAGAIAAPWWPLQVLCCLFNGVFVGMIFIVGHDACHGGLTPHEWLNH